MSWKDRLGSLGLQAMEPSWRRYRTCCGVRVPACELGKRFKGRRANDMIEIWGCFGTLDEYSKALMPENRVYLRARGKTLTNRPGIDAIATLVLVPCSYKCAQQRERHERKL